MRQGSQFVAGPWTLGRHYKWVNVGAILFVLLVVYSLDIPTGPKGVPWDSNFDWTYLNYSPLVLVVGILVGIWWVVSAKNKYTGPERTIDEDLGSASVEPPKAPAAPGP